jgi:hypothetical protein
MNDLSEFSDVLSKDVQVEEVSASEFEFEDGLWRLRRERNHWEICPSEDDSDEDTFIVEREDFVDGKFEFDIDGSEHELSLEDFDRIEKFAFENRLID